MAACEATFAPFQVWLRNRARSANPLSIRSFSPIHRDTLARSEAITAGGR